MRASSGSASEEPAPEGAEAGRAEAGRAAAGGRFAPLRALALSGGRALLRGGSSWTSFSRSSRTGLPNRALGARRLVGLAFAVLALRLLHLQVVEHERLFELAKDNILREEVLPAIRGVVRDREGRVLVDSEPSCTVAVDPFDRAYRATGRLERTLARLASIIEVEPAVMAATIEREKGSSYHPVALKRHLDPATVAYIEEHREELPGVSIQVEPRRRYVHGSLAAHFLGYVGEITDAEVGQAARGRPAAAALASGGGGGAGGDPDEGESEPGPAAGSAGAGGAAAGPRKYRAGDIIGRSGVELAFEDRICGRNGVRFVEVNALGRRADLLVPVTRFAGVRPPVAGEELVLTLDLALQEAAEAAFPDSLTGAAVLLDARTGEVLAALSRPAFDPNEFAKGLSGEAWQVLTTHPAHPLLNRVVRSAYPPGSVFKVVTGAAALARNSVGLKEYLRSCDGGYQFGSRHFGCHHVHGPLTFRDAMMVSCDAYFYQAGVRVGLDGLASYARLFGFGRPTGIELGDKKGLFPDAAYYDRHFGKGRWTKGLILNLAIGQGEVLATPLQLAVMMAAAGTGNLPVPHIIERIGEGRAVEPPRPRRLELADDVRAQLVEALERVVGDDRGTGKRSRVPGVRVAGKTGTAQNPHGEDHAVFAAFAPVESPEVAVAVVVENVGHGGEFAAPIAGKMLRAYFERPPAGQVAAVPEAGR